MLLLHSSVFIARGAYQLETIVFAVLNACANACNVHRILVLQVSECYGKNAANVYDGAHSSWMRSYYCYYCSCLDAIS
jgi:hypothetical protein